jgi:hypothetical protein
MGIREVVDARRIEVEQVLQRLTEARPARFDQSLPSALPKTHGLYAISRIDAPVGEYLHAGKTGKGRSGLWGRVWDQHYRTGGSPGDLLEKVKAKGHGGSAREARDFIQRSCQVQWVEVEDSALRGWAEHYVLALLKPIWGS